MGKLNRTLEKHDIIRQKSIPLPQQLSNNKSILKHGKIKKIKSEDKYLDSKLSKKIIKQAKQQIIDIKEEEEGNGIIQINPQKPSFHKFTFNNEKEDISLINQKTNEYLHKNETFDNTQILQQDLDAFDKFMSADLKERQNLVDIISDRLTEKKTELNTEILGEYKDTKNLTKNMNPKIVEMYRDVSKVLSQYRSGKLPKAFKIIPSLNDWENILTLTDPDKWTAGAMYQATKLFASNLNNRLVQRFYHKILLPRVRDDISEYKKLNYHLYQALYKAMYKQGAFFKGIIIPLCESTIITSISQDNIPACSLREAFILGTVLQKNSINILHACATILKLIEISKPSPFDAPMYSGPISIFLRILLDKKYELPYKVQDKLIDYYIQFKDNKTQLPVLWHQCLLSFVTNYISSLPESSKNDLLELIKCHFHPKISPVVQNNIKIPSKLLNNLINHIDHIIVKESLLMEE
ncbi:unnamed protein product [Gordionus sp. m RMFG-2023]|uniref:bystin-like n=1 Tax=Gordionus sp. m RMFG-2023 TaxID=3053472 RepID=UPI0030E43818